MAELGPNGEYPNRGLITVMIMLATIMQVLDTTIANVALPSMTGDLGASQDTITWVLTSYIVAAAIMTPVTGWLADQIGKRELFLISIVGFVAASLLCGLSWNLSSMVLFRVMQGIFGAAIADLSAGYQPARKGGFRHGDVGGRHHGRPDHRPDFGRLADRKLQLALGVPDQPAGRHHRHAGLCRLLAQIHQTHPTL